MPVTGCPSFFLHTLTMSLDYTPTTELEAVNAILAAFNEAPVSTLSGNRPDVVLAQAALSAALRETMAARWRFNSDVNYSLPGTLIAAGQYVFPEPAGLLAFSVTPTEAQRGLDIVSRPSRTYLVGGNKVRILANRIGGVDVLPQSELFINPVWAVPFDLAPEAARAFIVRSAIRRRAQQGGLKDQLEPALADEQSALATLKSSEQPGAPVVQSDGWATETDALNAILQMASQELVSDALEADGPSLTALNMLRQAVTDVCAIGWRFNTELGYGLAPVNAVLDWPDIDGTTTPVLIYLAPDRLLNAVATRVDEQLGSKFIDPIIRVATVYTDDDGKSPRVIYDRENHRDGFPQADRTVLWLDVTWRRPFAEMAEEARRYATIMAGRRFCASLGSTPRWTPEDEMGALRTLQNAEGRRDQRNIFTDNPGVRSFRGRRPFRDIRYV